MHDFKSGHRAAAGSVMNPAMHSRDTSKSEAIVLRFQQSAFKAIRKKMVFSGTWETTVEELFPLFCPVREADWIPGWDCELIYTESGYAEENCIFVTDESNSHGKGLWIFTGYKENQTIEFVNVGDDQVARAQISVVDNHNGTVSATWKVLLTGLTAKGNKEIEMLPESIPPQASPLVKMIEHYLKTGQTNKPTELD